MSDLTLEAIFKRDTAVVAFALLALMLLAWVCAPRQRRHRHESLRHERMEAAVRRTGGAEPDLDSGLLADCLLHVGDHDSGDDGALGLAHGRILWQAQRKGQVKNTSACIAAFAAGYLTLWSLFGVLLMLGGAAVIVSG
jgi:predicted metal-binding membrane protein